MWWTHQNLLFSKRSSRSSMGIFFIKAFSPVKPWFFSNFKHQLQRTEQLWTLIYQNVSRSSSEWSSRFNKTFRIDSYVCLVHVIAKQKILQSRGEYFAFSVEKLCAPVQLYWKVDTNSYFSVSHTVAFSCPFLPSNWPQFNRNWLCRGFSKIKKTKQKNSIQISALINWLETIEFRFV